MALAYAESADFVRYLRRDEAEQHRFRRLMRHLRDGEDFEDAVQQVYRRPVPALEFAWREELEERFSAIPLYLGGGLFWGLLTVLLILAFLRRKYVAAQKLRKWAEEEAEVDRVEKAIAVRILEQREAARQRDSAAPRGASPATSEVTPPVGPDEFPEDWENFEAPPEIPTVEHDGKRHVLH